MSEIELQADGSASSPQAALKVRHYNKNTNIKPQIDKAGNATTYYWELKNLIAGLKQEPYNSKSPYPIVYTAPSVFKISGYEGDLSSWKSFGKFFYDLNKGKDKLSASTKAELEKLVTNANNKIEKINIVYQYIQAKTRYVSVQLGIGGWQTFDAAYVEKNGFGDCKALTNFTQACLKHLGINSHGALVYSGNNVADITTDFPSNQFNHIILCVPMEKDSIWLECTSQSQPFNYLGSFTENRHVVLCKPTGGELVRTPKSTATDNQYQNTSKVSIDEKGMAVVQSFLHLTGIQQSDYRYRVTTYSPRELAEHLQKTIDLPSFEIANFDFYNIEQTHPALDLELNLRVRQFATKAGKRLLFYPNLLNRFDEVPPAISNRTQAVNLEQANLNTDTIYYQLPKGYEIEALPTAPITLNSEFGNYRVQYAITDKGSLLYTRQFRVNNLNLPPESYEELRQFLLAVYKADRQQLVLVKK